MAINQSSPDLTQHPPRSMRVKLGGYVHLPRILDKGRAANAGKLGNYNYNSPLDQLFFVFAGIDAEELKAQLATGKSDTEILAWINEKSSRAPFEIKAWSDWVIEVGPGSADSLAWFGGVFKEAAPKREDIRNFADLIDLDDYVSFGGKA